MSTRLYHETGMDKHKIPILPDAEPPFEEERLHVYEHSCPQCLGYQDGDATCPTCGGAGVVREVW